MWDYSHYSRMDFSSHWVFSLFQWANAVRAVVDALTSLIRSFFFTPIHTIPVIT